MTGPPAKFIWGLRKFFAEVTSVIPRLIRICASKGDIFNLLEISDCSPLLGGDKTHLLLIEYIYLTKRYDVFIVMGYYRVFYRSGNVGFPCPQRDN